MIELKIDPEFKNKIPPLTEDEFKQLEENIVSDGEVYEPIIAWRGVIVDGHNRWAIVQKHPEIPYKVKEMEFTDKWAAFEWMYRKQLGRRNLTDEQKTYMMGKMYEARKNTASFKGNQYTNGDGQNVHNQTLRERKDGTSGQIGKEFGVDGKTIRRAEHFANGIDALRAVSPEAADKVLEGKSKATRGAVAELKTAPEEEVKEFAKAVNEGKPIKAKTPRPMSPQMKDFSKKLLDVVSEMENTNKAYTLDDAIRDLNSAEDVFINQIEFILRARKSVLDADERTKEALIGYIESVIHDLEELKGRF